jgi:hypothetical protein
MQYEQRLTPAFTCILCRLNTYDEDFGAEFWARQV